MDEENRWMKRVRNEKVLKTVKEEIDLKQIILKRKGNWLGHILKGNGLLTMILERIVEEGKEERREK